MAYKPQIKKLDYYLSDTENDPRYVNVSGDTMTGALTIATNTTPLYLGDTTNASVYTSFNGRAFVGYDGSGNAVIQGSASKGIEFNVNNATFGSGTVMTLTTTGELQMPSATSSSTGILLGGDANLYRSGANTLATDDAMQVLGSSLYSQGNLTIGSGTTSVGLSVLASSFNGFTFDIYSDTASAYSFFRRSRGSFASPTVVTSGSFMGSIGFRGYADAGMPVQDAARVSGYATQTFSTTHGGAIGFYTAANGTLVSAGASERMTIYHDGNVGIGNTAPTFKLQLAAATTAAGGIGFGTDTNIYRSAANTLKTDDTLEASTAIRIGTSTSTATAGLNLVSGGAAQGIAFGTDVNLYRYTTDHLATDDKFSALRGLARTNIIISPEDTNNSVIPYYMNDLAYNRLRGGACRVYYDSVLQSSTDSNTDKMFDATAEAFSINSTGITEIVIEVDMCVSLFYGTKVGIAVNSVWKATNIKVEVYTLATTTWTTLYNSTWNDAESFWTHGGSANPITKLRYTFSGFNATYNIFRIGSIYTLNYASSLGADLFFTRNGGSIYGNTTLADGVNILTNTTTGTKIATATTQKLGFWNATPIVQPTTAVAAATFVANTSGIANDTATFDGYTIGQVVKALRNAGLLA